MGFQKQSGSNARNVTRNIVNAALNVAEVVCYDRVNSKVVEATSSAVPKDVAGIVATTTSLADIVADIQLIDYNDEYVVNTLNLSSLSHNYQRMALSNSGMVNNSGSDIETTGIFMQTDVIGAPEEKRIKGVFVRPYEPNNMAVRTMSATGEVNGNDGLIISTGTITITLPSAVGRTGKVITVKRNYAGGNTTVAPERLETIDGATSFTLDTDGQSFGFISDGSNYHIIN